MVLHHVAQRAGLVVELAAALDADCSATVICTWRMRPRRHSGSNSVLPKRSASRFCTVSLPR